MGLGRERGGDGGAGAGAARSRGPRAACGVCAGRHAGMGRVACGRGRRGRRPGCVCGRAGGACRRGARRRSVCGRAHRCAHRRVCRPVRCAARVDVRAVRCARSGRPSSGPGSGPSPGSARAERRAPCGAARGGAWCAWRRAWRDAWCRAWRPAWLWAWPWRARHERDACGRRSAARTAARDDPDRVVRDRGQARGAPAAAGHAAGRCVWLRRAACAAQRGGAFAGVAARHAHVLDAGPRQVPRPAARDDLARRRAEEAAGGRAVPRGADRRVGERRGLPAAQVGAVDGRGRRGGVRRRRRVAAHRGQDPAAAPAGASRAARRAAARRGARGVCAAAGPAAELGVFRIPCADVCADAAAGQGAAAAHVHAAPRVPRRAAGAAAAGRRARGRRPRGARKDVGARDGRGAALRRGGARRGDAGVCRLRVRRRGPRRRPRAAQGPHEPQGGVRPVHARDARADRRAVCRAVRVALGGRQARAVAAVGRDAPLEPARGRRRACAHGDRRRAHARRPARGRARVLPAGRRQRPARHAARQDAAVCVCGRDAGRAARGAAQGHGRAAHDRGARVCAGACADAQGPRGVRGHSGARPVQARARRGVRRAGRCGACEKVLRGARRREPRDQDADAPPRAALGAAPALEPPAPPAAQRRRRQLVGRPQALAPDARWDVGRSRGAPHQVYRRRGGGRREAGARVEWRACRGVYALQRHYTGHGRLARCAQPLRRRRRRAGNDVCARGLCGGLCRRGAAGRVRRGRLRRSLPAGRPHRGARELCG